MVQSFVERSKRGEFGAARTLPSEPVAPERLQVAALLLVTAYRISGARWATVENALAIGRGLRLAHAAAPRASAALGVATAAIAAFLVSSTTGDNSGWRASAVSDLLAPIPLQDLSPWSGPRTFSANDQSALSGSAIAIARRDR